MRRGGLSYIGANADSEGTVIVTGEGSLLKTDLSIAIGNSGAGTLTIEDGGKADLRHAVIGNNQNSEGTVTVRGASSAFITPGVIRVGNSGTGTVTIEDGASVTNDDIAYIAANQDSIGIVTVTGPGSLFNSKASLRVGNGGAGTLTIANGGTVKGANNSYIGNNAGSVGIVTLTGGESSLEIAGTLNIASNATATGTLNIGAAAGEAAAAAGTVSTGTIISFGAGAGKIVFNHTDNDYDFSASMSGSGTLSFDNGTTTLSGDSSGFNGTATVNAGTLRINGALGAGSQTTVTADARLEGGGTLGTLTLGSAGTIAPGNSIGTITIDGDFTADANSLYEVEISANGASDLIDVTGTATLAGAVKVIPLAGEYSANHDYTILTAAGGLGGTTFDSVTSINAFFAPELSYDANNVYLSIISTGVDFADIVGGGYGAAFDALPDNDPAREHLLTQSDEVIRQSITDAAQGPYAAQATVIPAMQAQINDTISARLTSLHLMQAVGAAAPAPATGVSGGDRVLSGGWMPADGKLGGWVKSYGANGEMSEGGDRLNWTFGGVSAGLDHALTPDSVVGLSAGYAVSSTKMMPGGAKSHADMWHVSGYGAWRSGHFHVQGQAGYSYAQSESKRTILFGGVPTELRGDYDTHTLTAAVEAGRDFAFEAQHKLVFTPLAGATYSWQHQPGFTEQGSTVGLQVAEDTSHSLKPSLGARVTLPKALPEGGFFIPSLTARVRHELGDTTSRLSAGFAGAGGAGPVFAVDGLDRARTEAALSVNVSYRQAAAAPLLFAAYETTQSATNDEHALLFGLRAEW